MESLREQPVLPPTSIPQVLLNPAIGISIALAVVIALLVFSRDTSNIPHANPPSWSSPMALLQTDAIERGLDILYNAKKRFPESVFRMIHVNGEITVLPPRFANPIRNEKGLSFARSVSNVGQMTPMKDVKDSLPRTSMLIFSDFLLSVSSSIENRWCKMLLGSHSLSS